MSASEPTPTDEKTMRRSFRIREAAFVHVRELSHSAFQNLLEARSMQRPSAFGNHARLVNLEARLQEQMALMGGAPRPVRECLTLLNEKINLLLEEQPERQAAMEELTKGQALQCEIGATGIRFDHHEALAEDSKIYLRIMLTSDRHYLETAAIVRREPKPLNNDPLLPHGVAAEFAGFSEAESELLIKHLFQRESESLRMRRLSLQD